MFTKLNFEHRAAIIQSAVTYIAANANEQTTNQFKEQLDVVCDILAAKLLSKLPPPKLQKTSTP